MFFNLKLFVMKRLLIATDQVELSDTIVKRGLGLSRKLHLPVDIVMVVDQATVFSEPNTGMIGAEAFEDQYQLNKDHLEELKQSILQKAFSGELTGAQQIKRSAVLA